MFPFLKIPKNSFLYVVIISLIITILLMRACSPGSPSVDEGKPKIEIKIDTQYIDKPIERKIYIPVPQGKIIPPDTVYKDVDTLAILKDYFSKYIYSDTIKIDSIGYVLIKDTISQNKIVSRQTEGKYIYPIITKEITITNPPILKNQVYVGGEIILGRSGINYLGSAFTLKTKKDKMYDLGIGLGNTPIGYEAQFKAGTKWKIKIRSKN